MTFEIEVYKLGSPGIALFSVKMTFDDVLDAIKLAKTIINEGQGFNVIER